MAVYEITKPLQRLLKITPGPHWIVSCYLKVEPRDRAGRKYLIKLKNRIRAREEWVAAQGLGRDEQDALKRDLGRIRDYLEDPARLPATRGIAIFASEPLGLMAAIPLPQVFRSRLAIDRTLLVRELAAVQDDFGVVYCALYDRTGARFFRVTAFEIEELPGLIPATDPSRTNRFHATSTPAGPGRGLAASGEYGHNLRIREEKHRQYAGVAQRLLEFSRTAGVRGFVLGTVGVGAEAVLPHLHPYIRGMVLGVTRMNPKTATLPEVQEAVIRVRREAERSDERRLVEQVREHLGSGWAVNGVQATLDAMAYGQVSTLLIRPDVALPGFRCKEWDRLSLQPDTCEGKATPVEDVIDDALEDALRQGSHVDVVETTDLQSQIDGLAGLLRFKVG